MFQSLRLRLASGFVGLALGPMLLMGLFYGVITYNDSVESAYYRQQVLAHRIGIEAGQILQQLQQQLQHTAEHLDFGSDNPQRQEELLNTLLVSSKLFTEVALIDSEGYAGLRLSLTSMVLDADSHQRSEAALLQLVRVAGGFSAGEVLFDEESGEPLIPVAYPLYGLYDGEFQGVLLGMGRLKALWELIERNNSNSEDNIYLTDGRDRVVAHKNPSLVLRGTTFVSAAGHGINSGLAATPVISGEYDLSFGEQHFHVIAERSAEAAMAPAYRALQVLVLVTLLSLALAGILILLAVRQVIRPIHELSTSTRALRDGDLSQRVAVDSDNELGELAAVFNGMAESLAMSIRSLEESESRYRLLVENQNDLIVKFDAEGRLLFVSPAYCETFGKESDELLGQPFVPMIHEEDRERVQASLQRLERPPHTTHHEERALTKTGYRWIAWSARGVVGENGRLREVISVGRDISEQKQLEEERREIEAQLRQAQKMEAIGQLTGGIAHDFNNILASILGYTYMAKERYVGGEGMAPLERYLDEIEKAGLRAKDLVSQMLSFSRGQAGERVALDLKPLVAEDIKMLRSIIPTTIDIHVECEENLPQVMVDPIQLHQVIMNLCINARDAIGGKGEIRLQLRYHDVERFVCSACDTTLSGAYIELQVSDSGSGIEAEVLPRIFQPFFSTKLPGKGTGMGLHTVASILHECGGHIQVESQVGEGTTFRLLFPLRPAEPVAWEERAAEVSMGEPLGTILVVDDEATVASLLREVLSDSGYRVVTAASGGDALELIQSTEESFDLLISDDKMAGLDGVGLARATYALRPRLPVIINSAAGLVLSSELRAQSNIKEVMRKPLHMRELLKVVQQHILPHYGAEDRATHEH